MILESCKCGWGIPGLDNLPSHYHYDETTVFRLSDGKTFSIIGVILPSAGYRILGVEKHIRPLVNWKNYVRSLLGSDNSSDSISSGSIV